MSFLTRWDDDRSRPKFTSALRDVFLRAVLPAVAIFLGIVGFGLLLKGPLLGLDKAEDGVSTWFEDERTATYNTITNFMSMVGNTEYVIGVCVVVVAVIWWRTRKWCMRGCWVPCRTWAYPNFPWPVCPVETHPRCRARRGWANTA